LKTYILKASAAHWGDWHVPCKSRGVLVRIEESPRASKRANSAHGENPNALRQEI
jgi:hypothetical protein